MSKSVVLSSIQHFLKSIGDIVSPKTTTMQWLRMLIIIAILLVITITYNKYTISKPQEGFQQNDSFVLKQNANIYDQFYTAKYDLLMQPKNRADFESEIIIKMTEPTSESVFLDVGCGTGHLVNNLQEKGYRVFGIDKSPEMVKQSGQNFPKGEIKCQNVEESMAFEHNTFTHILCNGMTVYHIQNKADFLRNCYHWLVPNGYLVIHLVDRNKFDTIIPVAKPTMIDNPQKYVKNRITKSAVDFPTFSYKAEYDFPEKDTKVVFKEYFTDKLGNIRQNENTLYMDSIDDILKMAVKIGFIVHAKVNMAKYNNDENQYLYVLERAM
jgi:2-polyprenyl-3-methyl-5-hydroxy-6-metoxy-1,4-benzoquinol methylase